MAPSRSRLLLHLFAWALVGGLTFASELGAHHLTVVHQDPAPETQEGLQEELPNELPPPESFVGEVGSPRFAPAPRAALTAVSGCLASCLLWLGYRRLRIPQRGVALFAGAALGTCAGALLWLVLFELGQAALYGGPPFEAGLHEAAGVLLGDVFIMSAWHGVALALSHVERAERAERLAQEARLAALRYQLNPHFLFNALNSAVALIDEAPARAQTMLTRLAGLLRSTLRDSPTTSLGQELALVERYLEIEKLRFEDRLTFECRCPDDARALAVPTLLVHTLVENAIKHGMGAAGPLRLRLACSHERGRLRIELANNGRLARGEGGGIGLRNLRERLDAVYPGRNLFGLEERDGEVLASVAIDAPERAR